MAVYLGKNKVSMTGYIKVNAEMKTEIKTVSPCEDEQTITSDEGFDALSKVILSPIDSNYIGSTVPRKGESDLRRSSNIVSIPSGYYGTDASVEIPLVSVPAGSWNVDANGVVSHNVSIPEGYVEAVSKNETMNLQTQSAKTITPNETEQTAVTSGKFTIGSIKVAAIPSNYIGSGVTIQKYYTGSTAPSSSLGNDGDLYLKV